MARLLILALLIVVVWIVVKRLAGSSKRPRSAAGSKPPPQEQILACALCGLHVPESEGLRIGEAFYCCEAHSRQANGPHAD